MTVYLAVHMKLTQHCKSINLNTDKLKHADQMLGCVREVGLNPKPMDGGVRDGGGGRWWLGPGEAS